MARCKECGAQVTHYGNIWLDNIKDKVKCGKCYLKQKAQERKGER